MQLSMFELRTPLKKCAEVPSPTRLHYLSFSTCPYESTTNSTNSPDRSSSYVRKRHEQPRAESIKSGCSRKSKYSTKNLLQKNCIFGKVESSQERDLYQKQSKEQNDEFEGLKTNLERLKARKGFIELQLDECQQKSLAKAKRTRGLIQRHFNLNYSE